MRAMSRCASCFELLHALGGQRQVDVGGHVRQRRQVALGAAPLLRVAPAVEIGLGQRVGLVRPRRGLAVDQHHFDGGRQLVEQAGVRVLEMDEQQNGVDQDRRASAIHSGRVPGSRNSGVTRSSDRSTGPALRR